MLIINAAELIKLGAFLDQYLKTTFKVFFLSTTFFGLFFKQCRPYKFSVIKMLRHVSAKSVPYKTTMMMLMTTMTTTMTMDIASKH